MSNTKDLNCKEVLNILKILVEDIKICLFCTDLKTDNGSICSAASLIAACNKGTMWLFSKKDSDKLEAIANVKNVEPYFLISQRAVF